MSLEKRLKEIKARCEAATPGEWKYSTQCLSIPKEVMNNHEFFEKNVKFIAHARQDIPMLLEMLEVARQDLQSIVNVSKDKGANLAKAALEDWGKIVEKYK